MSDYMFMLESHLSADQNRVLEQVQAAAGAAGVNLFLTGGGMRDMPICAVTPLGNSNSAVRRFSSIDSDRAPCSSSALATFRA